MIYWNGKGSGEIGEIVLGIDFGTAYSRAVAVVDGRAHAVLDAADPTIPSVVHFPAHGEPIVGQEALRYLASQPAATISSVKRLLGRQYTDPALRALDQGVGFHMKGGPGGMAVLRIHETDYAPAQVVALILGRLRELAERRFGGQIRRAVMSAPAETTDEYRQALTRAAQLAHLEVVQFVAEPLAGVLAYGLATQPARRRIAVCDFGGGTFDASFVEQDGRRFRAVGTTGDPFLGGDDFDEVLADGVAGVVFGRKRIDLHRDIVTWAELRLRCESVKRQLSSQPQVRLRLKEAYMSQGVYDVDLMIERSWIEPRWQPLVERAEGVIQSLLQKTGWRVEDLHEVVLIGGTVMIPLVQRVFAQTFGRPGKISAQANVAVAVGAALLAAWRSGRGNSSFPVLF